MDRARARRPGAGMPPRLLSPIALATSVAIRQAAQPPTPPVRSALSLAVEHLPWAPVSNLTPHVVRHAVLTHLGLI